MECSRHLRLVAPRASGDSRTLAAEVPGPILEPFTPRDERTGSLLVAEWPTTDQRQRRHRRFGEALRDLILRQGDRFLTPTGNVSWSMFARTLDGVNYESLRKAVAGERPPTIDMMERVAAALEVEPTYFVEYAAWRARRSFDPTEVGFDEAAENVERWLERDGD